MKRVEIFTDGACKGNPGPGGWGALLRMGKHEKELSGSDPHTTNNRMELTAAIRALGALIEPCQVTLYTDSKSVMDGITPIHSGPVQFNFVCLVRLHKKKTANGINTESSKSRSAR